MGIPIYPPQYEGDLLRPFYEGLERGELRLTAHPETGEWLWYPPDIVPGAPDLHPVWKTVSPLCTVHSFTTIHRSLLPGDHKAAVPFTVVLVESDDAPGARIPGLFVAAGDVEARCGMRVRLSPVEAGDHVVAGFEPLG